MSKEWEVYIDNDYIRAEETELCECVVTNKTDHDIYLLFNIGNPLSEVPRILAKGFISITDADLIRRIKAKEVMVFRWIDCTVGGLTA